MMKIKKIPFFVLTLAIMLSTGGPCVFPMLTAQASSGSMDMSSQDPTGGQDVVTGADGMGSMVHTPLTQSHVNNCSLECGKTKDNVGTVKKSKELSQLLALASQGIDRTPSYIDESSLKFLDPPEVSPIHGVLLSVAKKE